MTIIQGSTVEIDNAGATDFNALGDISDSQQVVFYNNSNTVLSARVIDITLATRTIDTVNAEQTLVTQAFHFHSITAAQLTSAKYLIAQTGTGAVSKARIGVANVSGTTVTYASAGELTPTDDDLQFIRGSEIIGLTSTTALWVYVEPVTANKTYARVISIDGSDNVSEGARTELSDDENDPWCVIVFSATKALFVYQDVSDLDKLKGRILTISGTTVTAEAVVLIDDNRTWDLFYWSMARVSSTKAAFLAQDNGGSTLVYGFVLTFDGTTSFTAGSEQGDFPVGVQNSSAASPNDQRFLWASRSGTTYTVYEFEVDVSLNTLSHTAGNKVDITTVNSSVFYSRLHAIAANHGMALTFSSIDGTIVETTAAPAAANAFRVLGLAADAGQLYVTGLKDAGLKLYTYSNLGDLIEGGTIHAFGAATDSDIDNLAAGIWPAIRPGADSVVWLYGLDGNGVQVQQNDLNGADGWIDLSAGVWSASQVLVALLIDPLKPTDLAALMDDNDIYRSQDEGQTWTKTGDASFLLKTGARHPTNGRETVLAGQAAGELEYSHNFGDSVDAISIEIGGEVEQRIAAGNDDGFVYNSRTLIDPSGNDIVIGPIGGLGQGEAWMRFTNPGIRPGATIITAHIEITKNASSQSGALTMDIAGDDSDNATVPTTGAQYNAKTRTTASVTWNVPDMVANTAYQTPELKTILQEIIDRPGYELDNAVQFLFDYNSGANRRNIVSFNANPNLAPLLYVEYMLTIGVVNKVTIR